MTLLHKIRRFLARPAIAFPLIIIELHDWMLPFSGNSRPFQKALLARDLDWVQRGENLFCYNPRLLAGLVES